MKTRMLKLVTALTLACSMFTPMMVSAAVNTTEEVSTPATKDCTVTASATSEWIVTIPKTITLAVTDGTGAADYSVSVVGNIDSTHKITVTPDATFDMTQGDNETHPATVTQTTTDFDGAALTLETATTTTGSISAPNLRAGSYDGNFNFHIAEVEK